VKILGGIIPVVSARNARFMNSEISGIDVDPRIEALMEGKDREECSRLAVMISNRVAEEIAPMVDGYYLMTPFQRTGLICQIVSHIRTLERGEK
jgi:homocysteine S-methyltransferase